MRLTLLDGPSTSRTLAVDENGVVWLQFSTGPWGRGCITCDGARHVFLRPAWAVNWEALSLNEFEERFSSAEEAIVPNATRRCPTPNGFTGQPCKRRTCPVCREAWDKAVKAVQ